ncbi:MAG: glycosyltransferase family 39 protein [Chloroflexi bacterium]|nr:glycosyltransferase family 39 protein [Chloroflexota bacterium]
MKTQPKTYLWLAVLPVLLLMTWFGARGLAADTYWLDEIWSLDFAGAAHFGPLSPLEIWNRTGAEAFSGPTYPLLLSAWGWQVGWTPYAARTSSLLLGVLAAALVYRLGRDLAAPGVGLVAAGAVGVSALYAYFLHELRNYTLTTVLLTVMLWAYWRIITDKRPPGRWLKIGLVAGGAALLYTHYYVALALPALALYHLTLAPKNRRWWLVVLLMFIGGVLFLPWAVLALQALSQMDALQASIVGEGFLTPPQMVERTLIFFSNNAVWLLIPALGLSLLGLRRWRRATIMIWFLTVAMLAGLMIANQRTTLIRPGRERYLLMLWPTLALLVGIGAAALWQTRLRLAAPLLAAAWLVIGIQANLDGGLTRDTDGAQALPWDALARALADGAQPDDAVMVHVTTYNWVLEFQPAEYHLYGLPVRFDLLAMYYGDNFPQAARDFVDGAAQVWVGLDKRLPPGDSLDRFTQTLAGVYAPCGVVFDLPRMRLDLYRRFPPSAFDAEHSAILRFGSSIALTYADVPPPTPGAPLVTTLVWALGADVPPYTYSVALHLENAAGELVAQSDYGLPLEAVACRQTDLPVDGLPSGEYTLLATVYDWASGARLPAKTATGETADRQPVARVTLDG